MCTPWNSGKKQIKAEIKEKLQETKEKTQIKSFKRKLIGPEHNGLYTVNNTKRKSSKLKELDKDSSYEESYDSEDLWWKKGFSPFEFKNNNELKELDKPSKGVKSDGSNISINNFTLIKLATKDANYKIISWQN